MPRLSLVTAIVTLVFSIAATSTASDVSVTGEVVDVACSLGKGDGGKGDAHAACAMSCARRGEPVGILTADALYIVTGDYTANKNAKLLDFVARNVVAKGTVSEKAGKKYLNLTGIYVKGKD